MASIFEYTIAYVEELSLFERQAEIARSSGIKGLAVKLYDGDGNSVIPENRTYLEQHAPGLRAAGFVLGTWACPRWEPVDKAASAVSIPYGRLGLSFCIFETEWIWKSDGGGRNVSDLLAAWRVVRPKAYTGFATEGGPPTTFNHNAVIADPYAFLCPENYWLQNASYDVRECLRRCQTLGYGPGKVKPTLTGVEGHTMAEAVIRAYRGDVWVAENVGHEPGKLLWRGDLLSDDDYRTYALADDLALR